MKISTKTVKQRYAEKEKTEKKKKQNKTKKKQREKKSGKPFSVFQLIW